MTNNEIQFFTQENICDMIGKRVLIRMPKSVCEYEIAAAAKVGLYNSVRLVNPVSKSEKWCSLDLLNFRFLKFM